MSTARNTLVGGFVLGGLALGAAAILIFSGRHLLRKQVHAVVVFHESVAGLTIGSPVTFRGVPIGEVKELQVHFNASDHAPLIPVSLALEPGKVIWAKETSADGEWDLADAVKAGLRAQLTQQSLITGQLSINLDLYPKAPPASGAIVDGTAQIPTIPSDAARLKDELLGLDIPDIGRKTRVALASLQRALDEVSANIGPASSSLQLTLDTARQTLNRYDQLGASAQKQLNANGQQLTALLDSTGKAMTEATAVVRSLDAMISPRSPERADLDAALRDLAASASSLRELTQDVERHPAATLLR